MRRKRKNKKNCSGHWRIECVGPQNSAEAKIRSEKVNEFIARCTIISVFGQNTLYYYYIRTAGLWLIWLRSWIHLQTCFILQVPFGCRAHIWSTDMWEHLPKNITGWSELGQRSPRERGLSSGHHLLCLTDFGMMSSFFLSFFFLHFCSFCVPTLVMDPLIHRRLKHLYTAACSNIHKRITQITGLCYLGVCKFGPRGTM